MNDPTWDSMDPRKNSPYREIDSTPTVRHVIETIVMELDVSLHEWED